MKDEKLGISIAFLSAIAVFFGWYNLTIAAVIAIGVICVSENEKLRKNVLVAFLAGILNSVIRLILGTISSWYVSLLIKLWNWEALRFFNSKWYGVLCKLDLCNYLLWIVKVAALIIMVVLIIMAFKGKELKFPIVSGWADKALGFAQEKNEKKKDTSDVTNATETLTDIPKKEN